MIYPRAPNEKNLLTQLNATSMFNSRFIGESIKFYFKLVRISRLECKNYSIPLTLRCKYKSYGNMLREKTK
ncbi:hypothetical protein BET03_03800 [Thermohalobacter berrensis]|uniref:Uncharacterized protein n=1 Tax=Thermohalobacter berrensis TaxID=99594 RepID=A0A419T1C4_9FIRM|nr:hypothetical protein BET03_03800 [Thermohalobacter berrensis]